MNTIELAQAVEAAIKPKYVEAPNGRGGLMIISKDYSEAVKLIENYEKHISNKILEFPRQPNKAGGWTIDYSFLNKLQMKLQLNNEYCNNISQEELEEILLEIEKEMINFTISNDVRIEGGEK